VSTVSVGDGTESLPVRPVLFTSAWFRDEASEFAARAFVSGLLVVFATRIGAEFVRTGHITGLLLLVSELLVLVMTITRRRAGTIDRSLYVRLITTVSVVGVPLIRPTGDALLADAATAFVTAGGLLVVIAGKIALGRSFGVLPAHRGLVTSGIYGVLRHPIYAGYLVTHIGFLAAHPSVRNLLLLVASDFCLILRARYEERTLQMDPGYVAYMARVRWRLIPGLY
jgi:protein-S-isoprenylcysteine O-methyltransferase Ste14